MDQQYILAGGQIGLGGNEDLSYELISHAVRSYSNAIGTQDVNDFAGDIWIDRNLAGIAGFGRRAHSHSVQFNGALVDFAVGGEESNVRDFWTTLVGDLVSKNYQTFLS